MPISTGHEASLNGLTFKTPNEEKGYGGKSPY